MVNTETRPKPRVVFFGSGPVAARSLELLTEHCDIEAVVTKPKPAHHRGTFPVLDLARRLKFPVQTVSSKTELDDLMASNPFKSDLGVLIDFGIIVSQAVIDYFPRGIVNSHFSILPEWRGADPITFAILSGQPTTGVSLMLLVAALDEGPLLAFGEYELPPNVTTPVLTEHLINLSDMLLRAELPNYLEGRRQGAPQTITGRQVSYSRKLTKEDGRVDWSKPAVQLEREVRAYIDWPKSRATLAGKDVIITEAHVTDKNGTPGEPITDGNELTVYCGKQALTLDHLKPAGKQEMTGADFIRGYLNK